MSNAARLADTLPRSKTDMTGRTVVLTGGGAGIGRAIALTLAGHGAKVAILDRIPERIDAVISEVEALDASALGIAVDVADEQAVEAAITQVAGTWGKLDVLVNCAGIYDELRPAATTSTELWNRVIGVNLTGAFIMTRAVLPHMVRSGSGVIVNIASEAGFRGGCGGAAYTASKHGLIGLTRSTAWGYRADGIRCNALCPGGIGDTQILSESGFDETYAERCFPIMSLAGEPGVPQSIADGILFLASDLSAFVNGVVLPVDGGWNAG
jgi:NAD(P)-dependent dehydrogenase (short-subunit alcohol dehydrogenase family)